MGNLHTLRLDRNDIGQILDGLRCRAESWRQTAEYLDSGCTNGANFILEECSDAEEARSIAEHYERIIHSIKKQLG
jgi:hypothetical protein